MLTASAGLESWQFHSSLKGTDCPERTNTLPDLFPPEL